MSKEIARLEPTCAGARIYVYGVEIPGFAAGCNSDAAKQAVVDRINHEASLQNTPPADSVHTFAEVQAAIDKIEFDMSRGKHTVFSIFYAMKDLVKYARGLYTSTTADSGQITAEQIFEHIKHGDEDHQAWLIAKLREIISAPATDVESLSNMNAALCVFSKRWKLDGDYLRCKSCNRPHLAGYADRPFIHAEDCRFKNVGAEYPWRLVLNILNPLYTSPPAREGWRPTEVYCVSNKVSSAFFLLKESAEKVIASGVPALGMSITAIPLLDVGSAPSIAPEAGDNKPTTEHCDVSEHK